MDSQDDKRLGAKAHSPDHWENYWNGAGDQGDARDAAVTGAGRSEAFQSAWRLFFDHINIEQNDGGMRLMDLACGGGVVTDNAISVLTTPRLACSCLVGVDYSSSAARRYSVKFSRSGAALAVGVVGDALALPFESGSVDVAVSQFGLEYAGAAAVAEASRLVAVKGRIMCLTHYQSGAIDRECRANLRIADAIISSDTLGIARTLFDKPEASGAEQKLTHVLQSLIGLADESPASAGSRLLTRLRLDLTRLAARRAAFSPNEAIGWIDANAAEISMYRDRMQSMTGAALEKKQISDVVEQWKANGLEVEEPVAIETAEAPTPSAWRLSARRPEN